MDWLHWGENHIRYKGKCGPIFANTYSTMLPLVLMKIFVWINPSTSSPTLNKLSPGSTTTPKNLTLGTAGTMGINYLDEDQPYLCNLTAVIHLVAATDQQAPEAWACAWHCICKCHTSKKDNLHLVESHSLDLDKNVITSWSRPEYIYISNMQNIKWQTLPVQLPLFLTWGDIYERLSEP